ncbi:MAG: M48 family metallopeptidase [Candidatus Niyogibacteria bacterium]|nr:M48 family metallopeptidase [Candidatus Niyogibacteria bacterium]
MSLYNTYQGKNIRKTWLLFTIFLIVIIGVGWAFSRIYANPSVLYFAVIFSVLMNVAAYWYSDKIVLKMARAIPAEKASFPELYNVVENLCIAADLPLPKIYLIHERQPNAFATGRNPERAAVAVTDGLLEKLDRSELEGVLAHELSHIGNRDMLLSTIIVVLAGFVSIISDMFLRSSFWGGFGRRDDREGGQAGSILMIIGIILSILAPIAAMLIQLAISRKREFLADASGALLTRYPEGLAKALEKISADASPSCVANNATAHLWISDPHGRQHGTLAKLFMTHPPIEERISKLRNMSV